MDLIYIIIGFVLILAGANYLTDGSAAIAKRLNISEFIIGLTVVAIGTSLPEGVVSVLSALSGSGDLSIGNVAGSNIFNALVVLGTCAIIKPISLNRNNIRHDIPLAILASLIMLLVTFGGTIYRAYGVVMVFIYIALIFSSIRRSMRNPESVETEEGEYIKQLPMWLALTMTIGGFGALIFGGNMLLEGATSFARSAGISDKIIAITLLAGGTSLPEYAASVIALVKGKSGIALGNVIGSNVANILLVLGTSSAIYPLSVVGIGIYDLLMVVGSSAILLLGVLFSKKGIIGRWMGAAMIVIYAAYIYMLIAQ